MRFKGRFLELYQDIGWALHLAVEGQWLAWVTWLATGLCLKIGWV